MTGPRRISHADAEELISGSLTGDLTDDEARALDTHLAGCSRCRATADAWAGSRRLLSGVRHVSAPRDLGARVRAGVERGRFAPVPWWRRPGFAMTSVGALAAAVVALAVIVGIPRTPTPVASGSPSATASASTSSVSASPVASTSPLPPSPSGDATATAEPSVAPAPPAYRLEYAFDVPGDITQGTTITVVDGGSGSVVRSLHAGTDIVGGPPIQASLSPSGAWLALRIQLDAKGTEHLYAMALSGDTIVDLGETLPDPFSERMPWSPGDGAYLAFTLVDPANGDADVSIFDAAAGTVTQLTSGGSAYAGSWNLTSTADPVLWVSLAAGGGPTSYLVTIGAGGVVPERINPADDSGQSTSVDQYVANDTFVPLLSPDGQHVISWRGTMEATSSGWRMATGGSLRLTGPDPNGAGELLLPEMGTTLEHGFVAWSANSDAYAVWSIGAVGASLVPTVWLGHLSTSPSVLTDAQRLDRNDVPLDGTIRDVAVAADGRHVAITVSYPVAGDLAQPTAELRLVTRNFGTEADTVVTLGGDVWVGPAVYAP